MSDDSPWTPEWVKHAVFYQIFPDRFANAEPARSPENVEPWGTPPTIHNFMGGDLRGIINHLDYVRQLGVTAIYLNPIFQATSSHKYNTFDYFTIDPHFGDLATFHELRDACHARGIKVVLDGVFNHCGRGFYAFQDVMENGLYSPYSKWFYIDGFPIYPYDESRPANYRSWWGIRSLPQFNIWHPPVREFLLSVGRYWIEQGADGWRLDVPNEVADHEFWREFRRQIKAINPEAYIVGEIWQDGAPWLDGTQFDAVMNYVLRDICVDFFAKASIRADAFAQRIETLLSRYPRDVTLVQLNLLDSHDTARFLTQAGGSVARLKLAWLFLSVYPGAPCIYYGDEIGMSGESDPYCRACFPWDETQWNQELLRFITQTIALRQAHPALRTGRYQTLQADATMNLYAFARSDERETIIALLNNAERPLTLASLPIDSLNLPDGAVCIDLLSQQRYQLGKGRLPEILLPALGAAVLCVTHASDV
jgi:glycosidase